MNTYKLIKYQNRKVYSKELSKYVSGRFIKTLIDDGFKVVIEEHNTGKDVTASTLIGMAATMLVSGEIFNAKTLTMYANELL